MSGAGAKRTDRETRRVELGERILEAVSRLEEQDEPFTTVSIEKIAVEAGMGRSTFYLYFQDKTELLMVWFTAIAAEIHAVNRGWAAIDRSVVKADVHRLLEETVAVYRSNAVALSIIFDATSYDPIIRELVARAMAADAQVMAKHIRLGQKQGWIHQDVLPRETATWLSWMAQSGGHKLVRLRDESGLADLIGGYTDMIWGSLYVTDSFEAVTLSAPA
jgi:AcrR family transcriptional regulator